MLFCPARINAITEPDKVYAMGGFRELVSIRALFEAGFGLVQSADRVEAWDDLPSQRGRHCHLASVLLSRLAED